MLQKFYTKVLADELIGPIFKEVLGADMQKKHWQAHLKVIASFWIQTAFGKRVYKGDPLAPHLRLPDIEKVHFQRWIELFSEVTDSMYEPGLSHLFKLRAKTIAGNFMRHLRLGEL